MHMKTNVDTHQQPAEYGQLTSLKRVMNAAVPVFVVLTYIVSASSVIAVGNEEEDMIQQDVMYSTPYDVTNLQKKSADSIGYSLLAGGSFFLGSNSNVHQSPDSLSMSSRGNGNWLFLRSDKQFGKNVEMINSFTWKHQSYSSSAEANLSRGYFSNWLEVKLSKAIKLTLDIDIDGANDDATKITGEPYNRDYSYMRYSAETIMTWNVGGPHRIQLGGNVMQNNYGEIVNMVSYDWNWHEGLLRYRYRIGPNHYLKMSYAVARKWYSERPSYSAANPEFDTTGNPVENDHYRALRVSWELPAAKWFDASLTYTHRSRADLFEGARSWSSDKWQVWMGARPSKRLEVSSEIGFMNQDFSKRLGDNSQPLATKSWDVQAGARFTLTSAVRLFTAIGFGGRDSNKDISPTYSYSSYLDYSGSTAVFGISFFFLTK